MKNHFILFITISAMLAAPSINAMAGYSFHFEASKPSWTFKALLQPDKFYTEHVQPEDTRPSKEYVDEVFKMKNVMGIKTPIVVKSENIPRNRAIASATNYPFFSRLRLNENIFARNTSRYLTFDNTATLAHELSHIKNKDHHLQWSLAYLQDGLRLIGNAALCSAGLSVLSRTKRQFAPLSLMAGLFTKFATQEINKKIDNTLDALEPKTLQEKQSISNTKESLPLIWVHIKHYPNAAIVRRSKR